jgi:hypothetical protein
MGRRIEPTSKSITSLYADDIVATIDDASGPTFTIDLVNKGKTATMTLHRLATDGGTCGRPRTIHTSIIDAGPIYGTDEVYLKTILRETGTCRFRASDGGMLPITTRADESGRFFFIAGDLRVDEHAVLTAMHTVWLREHNRLCDEIAVRHADWSVDAQFNLVRSVRSNASSPSSNYHRLIIFSFHVYILHLLQARIILRRLKFTITLVKA